MGCGMSFMWRKRWTVLQFEAVVSHDLPATVSTPETTRNETKGKKNEDVENWSHDLWVLVGVTGEGSMKTSVRSVGRSFKVS